MLIYTFENGWKILLCFFANPILLQNGTFSFYVFYLLFSLEILILLITTLCYSIFIKILHQSAQFHPNLIKIFRFFSIIMLLHGPERFILMFYQFELFKMHESLWSDWILLTISEMRTFTGCTSGFIVQAIICERIFATYYIWHYENLEKSHVYKIVLFGLFCCSGTCSVFVPIWYTIAPVTAMAVAMSFYIIFALIMFLIYWYLWVHNHDVLHVLSDVHFTMQYTLGVKFQVQENIRAIKLLRIFVGFDTAFVGANCLFGIIVMLITDQEKPSGQVALQLLELSIAVYTLSMLLLSLYFVKDWGEQFKKRLFNCFGQNLRLLSSKNSIVPLNSIQETEIYFNYYTQNWN